MRSCPPSQTGWWWTAQWPAVPFERWRPWRSTPWPRVSSKMSYSFALESLSELEVNLPAGFVLVEPVGVIETEWPEWCYDHRADTGASQQPRRIDFAE